MDATPQDLAIKLEMEGKNAIAFFSDISSEEWGKSVYTDGASWTILEILKHITQAEDSVSRLIEGILAGGEGTAVNFDLNSYNEHKVKQMDGMIAEELLTLFETRRAQTVKMVKNMSPEELQMEGNHPFLGNAKISEMIRIMYIHTIAHQRDIRKSKAKS